MWVQIYIMYNTQSQEAFYTQIFAYTLNIYR